MIVAAVLGLAAGSATGDPAGSELRLFDGHIHYSQDVWEAIEPAAAIERLRAAGIEWFLTQKISWNQANRFPHHTFWWEGIDGSQVFTHFPPVDTYNAEITPAEFAFSVANFQDHGWSTDSLMPFGHGDGGGGPTREMVERARRLAIIDARATLEIDTPAPAEDWYRVELADGEAMTAGVAGEREHVHVAGRVDATLDQQRQLDRLGLRTRIVGFLLGHGHRSCAGVREDGLRRSRGVGHREHAVQAQRVDVL